MLSIDLKKRNEGVGGKLKGEQIYMDTILFFMLSVAFVIFRFFFQFGYAGSQLRHVGSCSLTRD